MRLVACPAIIVVTPIVAHAVAGLVAFTLLQLAFGRAQVDLCQAMGICVHNLRSKVWGLPASVNDQTILMPDHESCFHADAWRIVCAMASTSSVARNWLSMPWRRQSFVTSAHCGLRPELILQWQLQSRICG